MFADWSPPPFDATLDPGPETLEGASELAPSNLGYQVVWRAWDDTAASLEVAPPGAVTLADDAALETRAAPPRGDGDGDGTGTKRLQASAEGRTNPQPLRVSRLRSRPACASRV